MDEKGNLTGYDVEILKEVEKRNPDIHFEYKMMPTSAAFVAIESGQADIVANQVGYTDERAAKTIYTKEVNNYTARKLAVRNDRYEVSITDAVKTLGLPIKAVGPVISSVPTYFALKKDDDHQKLADTIDKTLKDMKADGTLKKLSEQFLSKDYTVPQQ